MKLLKKSLMILLSLILVVSLAACTPKQEEVANEPAAEENTEAVSEDLEDKLVIYSTHGEDMLEVVAAGFTEKTGVEVEFINLKGELADRVRAEKDSPQADIMYGGASSLYITMSEEGIFESINPSWASSLNPDFKDAESLANRIVYNNFDENIDDVVNSVLFHYRKAYKWKMMA